MTLKRWKKLSEKIVAQNDYWSYNLDKFEVEGGKIGEYHYLHTLGSTLILPIDLNGRIILVEQFRYLNQRNSLEFPCGSVDKNFSIEENAIKELREETGFGSDRLTKIGSFAPFTGASDEICTVFIAEDLYDAPLKADEFEEFEIKRMLPMQIEELINNNTIYDGMTIAAWHLAEKYLSI